MGLAVKLDLLQQKGLEVEITGSRDLWIGDAELLPGKRKELGESNSLSTLKVNFLTTDPRVLSKP